MLSADQRSQRSVPKAEETVLEKVFVCEQVSPTCANADVAIRETARMIIFINPPKDVWFRLSARTIGPKAREVGILEKKIGLIEL